MFYFETFSVNSKLLTLKATTAVVCRKTSKSKDSSDESLHQEIIIIWTWFCSALIILVALYPGLVGVLLPGDP